jgi:acyl-CoA thioester hydrolase
MPSSVSHLRVRYAETDKMGVAYYANYFAWFEVGRAELLRSAGHTYRALEEQGVMLPVIEASCRYLQPGRYDDELQITATGQLLSPVRLAFDYEVARTGDGTVLAVGRTVHAAISAEGRPCRLPPHIQELFSS